MGVPLMENGNTQVISQVLSSLCSIYSLNWFLRLMPAFFEKKCQLFSKLIFSSELLQKKIYSEYVR